MNANLLIHLARLLSVLTVVAGAMSICRAEEKKVLWGSPLPKGWVVVGIGTDTWSIKKAGKEETIVEWSPIPDNYYVVKVGSRTRIIPPGIVQRYSIYVIREPRNVEWIVDGRGVPDGYIATSKKWEQNLWWIKVEKVVNSRNALAGYPIPKNHSVVETVVTGAGDNEEQYWVVGEAAEGQEVIAFTPLAEGFVVASVLGDESNPKWKIKIARSEEVIPARTPIPDGYLVIDSEPAVSASGASAEVQWKIKKLSNTVSPLRMLANTPIPNGSAVVAAEREGGKLFWRLENAFVGPTILSTSVPEAFSMAYNQSREEGDEADLPISRSKPGAEIDSAIVAKSQSAIGGGKAYTLVTATDGQSTKAQTASSSRRHQVWAGPQVFGPWQIVAAHAGSFTFQIDVEPIGSTVVVGEVQYYDENNNVRTQSFFKRVTFTTGNSVSNIAVRLKGSPTGSSCWVDVSP